MIASVIISQENGSVLLYLGLHPAAASTSAQSMLRVSRGDSVQNIFFDFIWFSNMSIHWFEIYLLEVKAGRATDHGYQSAIWLRQVSPAVPSTERVRLWIQLKFWVVISGKQARFRSSEGRLWNEFYKQTVILYDKSKGSSAKHAAFVDSVVHIRCVWLSTWVLAACKTEGCVFPCWHVLYNYDLDTYWVNVALHRRMLIPSARLHRKIW